MDAINDKLCLISDKFVDSSPGKRIQHKMTFYVDRPEGRPRDFFLLPTSMNISTYDKSAIQKDPDGTKNEVANQLWIRSSQPWSGYIEWDDKSGENHDGIEKIEGFKTIYKNKVVYEWKMYNYVSRYKKRYSGYGKYDISDTSKDVMIEDHACVNHIFEDDTIRNRIVVFHITDGYIEYISSQSNDYQVFPSLEMPELKGIDFTTCYFRTIPFDRFMYCPNLEQIGLGNTIKYDANKFTVLPSSLTKLKKVYELTLDKDMKLSEINNIDTNGIRELGNIDRLNYLSIIGCTNHYPKEFNNLSYLNTLNMYNNDSSKLDIHLKMFDNDNITEINPNLTTINTIGANGNWNLEDIAANATGPEYDKITNLENLTQYPYFNRIKAGETLVLHDWMDRCFNCKKLDINYIFSNDKTSTTIDKGIEVIYNHVKQFGYNQYYQDGDYIGKRNPWYGLNLVLFSNTSNGNVRPSGTYQEPEGFVQGENDGTLASAMEYLYVLANNYKYTIVVRNVSSSQTINPLALEDDDFGYEINSLEDLERLDEIEELATYTDVTINDDLLCTIEGSIDEVEILTYEDNYSNINIS